MFHVGVGCKNDVVVGRLQYSGGPGLAAGYCRSCTVALAVDILPSVVVTKWDVLPAETASHCYLVLDLLNATPHEMELHYRWLAPSWPC